MIKTGQKVFASLAIMGMLLGTFVPKALAENNTPQRLAGTDSALTAVKIADQTGWTGSAVLASSAPYGMVDALSSGPLAFFLKAPILLQEPGSSLNFYTKSALVRLNIKKVYVTSGTAVISQAVLNEIEAMDITVIPLGGTDRFQTSVNIAEEMAELGASITKVAVAYGWLNQDALSIAAIASAQTEPILLTETNSVPNCVQQFLAENENVAAADIIGGTAVISEAAAAGFPNAVRCYGSTAYDTNLQVLKAFDNVLNYDKVFIANGETAIDALAGAPLAAQYNAGIVLTKGTANEGTNYLVSRLKSGSIVSALGGSAVIPDALLADLFSAQTLSAAIHKIDGIVQNGDASSISEQDLIDGMGEYVFIYKDRLEAYQAEISSAPDFALDTKAKILEMVRKVNIAQAKLDNENAARNYAIRKIDEIPMNAPAASIPLYYLRDAGVPGEEVSEANLTAYQAAISAAPDLALDTTDEILRMVRDVNTAQAAAAERARIAALAKIDGIILTGDASSVTRQDLIDAGAMPSDVMDANLTAYRSAISSAPDLALDTTDEILQMVAAVNTAEAAKEAARIEAVRVAAVAGIDEIPQYGDASSISMQDLMDAGVYPSVIVDVLLAKYQAAISAAADHALDTSDEILQMVYDVNRTF